MEMMRKKLSFDEGMYIEPERMSGGLALWWKNEMVVKVLIGNKNVIDTIIMVPKVIVVLRVMWIYGVPRFEERKGVWEYIKRNVRGSKDPLICVGDFNDVLYENENEGFNGQKFTWFGIREGVLIKERLDRILVNLEWMEEFPNIQVTNLLAVGSDHSPIVMETKHKDRKGERKFKVEAIWVIMKGCEKVVKKGWEKRFERTNVDQVVEKLEYCKKLLIDWSKKVVPNNKKLIAELMQKIRERQNCVDSVQGYEEVKEMKNQIRQAWERDEVFWYQKAKVNWLNMGIRTQDFFINQPSKEEEEIKF
ncbi:hypothetical protein CRYUN_Cryun24cG0048500 [Craigia yunnanensis]